MGAATNLICSKDANRWVLDGVCNQSGYIAAMVFSGAAAKTSTPPAGARFVRLTRCGSTTSNSFFKVGGAAAVPASDVTDGSASQQLTAGESTMVSLDGATTVGVAASAACIVTLVYYK